jgi:hypothetical protein
MVILDTQIISYAYKGAFNQDITGQTISCLTAKEFLLLQYGEIDKPDYYVPLVPQRMGANDLAEGSLQFRMDHPFSVRSTDFTLLEFGQDFSPLREYCNTAVSSLINNENKIYYRESIRFLPKPKRKLLKHKFDFVLSEKLRCLPLSQNAIDLGFDLLYEFSKQFNIKGNFRNSIYDLLILAAAIENEAILKTKDSVLNRFAIEYSGALLAEREKHIEIEFSNSSQKIRKRSTESKGYINRGWHYKMQNTRGAF